MGGRSLTLGAAASRESAILVGRHPRQEGAREGPGSGRRCRRWPPAGSVARQRRLAEGRPSLSTTSLKDSKSMGWPKPTGLSRRRRARWNCGRPERVGSQFLNSLGPMIVYPPIGANKPRVVPDSHPAAKATAQPRPQGRLKPALRNNRFRKTCGGGNERYNANLNVIDSRSDSTSRTFCIRQDGDC